VPSPNVVISGCAFRSPTTLPCYKQLIKLKVNIMSNEILEITKTQRLEECELLTLLGKALDLAVEEDIMDTSTANKIALLITKKRW
jgi:hypothetical protein